MELSSQCWIFSCWSINFKVVLFIVVIVISIYLKLHFHKFQSIANCWLRFYSDQTRIKSLLKRLKYIGMASEKLYRNTLSFLRKTFFGSSHIAILIPSFDTLCQEHMGTMTLPLCGLNMKKTNGLSILSLFVQPAGHAIVGWLFSCFFFSNN